MQKDKAALPPPASPNRIELPDSLLREIGDLLGVFLAKVPNPEPGAIAADESAPESYDD